MELIVCNVAALAVALLYCVWQAHRGFIHRRQRMTRERVAYLLWVLAD